jgi:hypothetical protein
MSETLQQKLGTRAISTDRQRLDQLAAKQSRTLVPVIATGSKTRTPSSKYMAPLRPAANLSSRAPPDSPFARKAGIPGPIERSASLQRSHSANGSAVAAAAAAAAVPHAAAPSGMVALKPAGSGKLHERTSFFDSLRRKPSLAEPSSVEQAPGGSKLASACSAPPAGAGSIPAAAAGPASPPAGNTANGNSSTAAAANAGQDAAPVLAASPAVLESACSGELQNNLGSGGSSGPAKLRLLAEEEEEAFLRSLGWEEPEDGEEGGLTEEEIAAFLATSVARPKARAAPLQLPAGASRQAHILARSSSSSRATSCSGSESD